MKVVHVYSRHLKIFEDALADTGCCMNGTKDLNYLMKSLPNFNARDVLGLVIFRQHLTKKTLRLVRTFDELFVFNPRPIIVMCDEATELYSTRVLKVKSSPLFLVNTLSGTVSDVELRRVFTTLVCMSSEMYNVRSVEQVHGIGDKGDNVSVISDGNATIKLVDEVLSELKELGV